MDQLERESKKLGKIDLVPMGQPVPAKTVYSSEGYKRDATIVAYVKTQANGVCECCREPSPFVRDADGEPYLEVHHVKQLADGGSDTVSNAVGLCPTCHRELHHGREAETLKERLYVNVHRLEVE
jgi:5-methylcytosine-specific restriction protein A